ncbi:DUF3995 domain-containing protein [Leifsonia sp. PS1209]|uniref:DUF3995 domain-containing protein n=1 Tax=Leifsonia sp. PS1209 TaxID=2724914 RepID=UPI001442B284|nr:DUF3995 domain-containing protein [Leifsonia sp. PS1209]QIZ97460.1 DUF3995 domain-containing protein [Leifsonia sp. PS1209]
MSGEVRMTEGKAFQSVVAWLSLVRNLLALIVTGAAAIPLLLVWGRGLPTWLLQTLLIALVFVLGALTGALVALLVLRKRDAPLGYRWLRLERTREFDQVNPRRQRMVSHITIQARRDNVEIFQDLIQWTGAIKPRQSILSDGHSLLPVEIPGIDGWQRYYVHLGQPLMRGDLAEIVIQTEFIDVSDDSAHWISKTVRETILNELVLRLRMGAFTPPKTQFQAKVSDPSKDASSILKRLDVEYDITTGDVSVKIARPKVGRRYGLAALPWTYPADLPDATLGNATWPPTHLSAAAPAER